MKDVTRLVETVRDFSRQLEDRHGAFGALVKRYQDMAFGCAYAVLGDFYLAEDCAQEAFITAWQSIAQLRTPEAFSGWLRRIVLTKCNRLTRGRRLHIVPLELGQGVPSKTPDPQSVVERRDVSGRVLAAIQALPDNERIATTLFYVNGYTQVEIGEFLDIPETTVNKRLYSARQRLKQKETVAQFRTDLRHHRPSRDESFADKLSARLRPFADQDWPVVSTMTSAAKEGDEKASEDWLRKRKEFKEASYVRRHYIAEHAKNGRLLGYGSIEQSVFLPRYRLILVVDPRWLERGVGELLLERLTKDLIDVGAVIVSFRDYQSANEVQQFLKKHGFTETTRVNDMRLEVKLFDVSKFARSLERVQEQEIKISTLAAERISDPHYIEKLYRLTSELSLDDPGRSSFAPAAYYEREARLWLEQPYVLPDGYFIAKDQDQ